MACFPKEEKHLSYKKTHKTHHCGKPPDVLKVNQEDLKPNWWGWYIYAFDAAADFALHVNANPNVKRVLMSNIVVKNYLWETGTIPVDKVGGIWKCRKTGISQFSQNLAFQKVHVNPCKISKTIHMRWETVLIYCGGK